MTSLRRFVALFESLQPMPRFDPRSDPEDTRTDEPQAGDAPAQPAQASLE